MRALERLAVGPAGERDDLLDLPRRRLHARSRAPSPRRRPPAARRRGAPRAGGRRSGRRSGSGRSPRAASSSASAIAGSTVARRPRRRPGRRPSGVPRPPRPARRPRRGPRLGVDAIASFSISRASRCWLAPTIATSALAASPSSRRPFLACPTGHPLRHLPRLRRRVVAQLAARLLDRLGERLQRLAAHDQHQHGVRAACAPSAAISGSSSAAFHAADVVDEQVARALAEGQRGEGGGHLLGRGRLARRRAPGPPGPCSASARMRRRVRHASIFASSSPEIEVDGLEVGHATMLRRARDGRRARAHRPCRPRSSGARCRCGRCARSAPRPLAGRRAWTGAGWP